MSGTVGRKPVSYWHLFRRLHLIWLLFPLAFAIGFGAVGYGLARQSSLLEREGVVTQGVVIDKRISRSRDSDGNETRTYYLSVRYQPEGRAGPVVMRRSVSRQLYSATEIEDTIPVTYAWSRPETASLDPANDRVGAWIFGTVGAVASLVSLALGGWMLRRKLSIIRALRHGDIREARVTSIERTNVQKNRQQQYALEWVDAAGQTGRSMMAPFEKLAQYPIDSVIVVYIDPQTGRGWWEAQI